MLILLMAIAMLHANKSPIRQTEEEESESIEKGSVAIAIEFIANGMKSLFPGLA